VCAGGAAAWGAAPPPTADPAARGGAPPPPPPPPAHRGDVRSSPAGWRPAAGACRVPRVALYAAQVLDLSANGFGEADALTLADAVVRNADGQGKLRELQLNKNPLVLRPCARSHARAQRTRTNAHAWASSTPVCFGPPPLRVLAPCVS
jgi:hypothetical protein